MQWLNQCDPWGYDLHVYMTDINSEFPGEMWVKIEVAIFKLILVIDGEGNYCEIVLI